MTEAIPDNERSPKGDHNRRLALGIDIDVFAQNAGVSTDELHDYETTGPDGKFDLVVAHKVGVALERYETGEGLDNAVPPESYKPKKLSSVPDASPERIRVTPAYWDKTDGR